MLSGQRRGNCSQVQMWLFCCKEMLLLSDLFTWWEDGLEGGSEEEHLSLSSSDPSWVAIFSRLMARVVVLWGTATTSPVGISVYGRWQKITFFVQLSKNKHPVLLFVLWRNTQRTHVSQQGCWGTQTLPRAVGDHCTWRKPLVFHLFAVPPCHLSPREEECRCESKQHVIAWIFF